MCLENGIENRIIIVRGGGDLATGVVQKFHRAGFNVLILEAQAPTAIRRSVSLCEAIYEGHAYVEDIVCRSVRGMGELEACWASGAVPLLIDAEGVSIGKIKPSAVIDAIVAKRNMGTTRDMADVTIALGPGFEAGKDVNAVIETMRGHDLGRLILSGHAKPNTGIPGVIADESIRRVLYSPTSGFIAHCKEIGSVVECGDVLCSISCDNNLRTRTKTIEVKAPISGLLRGLIREGIVVQRGMKIADIDPRLDVSWRTISDKARCIGGAALEAYFYLIKKL